MKARSRSVVGFALLLFSALPTSAEPIDVKLIDASLVQFAHLVLSEIDRRSYILADDFLKAEQFVTVDLVDVEPSKVVDHMRRVVESFGFACIDVDGVLYLTKKPANREDSEVMVYRPRHRPADYLRELAGTIVDSKGFTTSRVLSGSIDVGKNENDSSVLSNLSRRELDAIVYQGAASDVRKLEKLFAQLDTPPGEVVVKAVLYEVRKGSKDNNAISAVLGLLDSVRGLGVSVSLGTVDDKNAVKIRTENASAVWSMLDSDSRFKAVSAPTMRIKSGEHGKFVAGEEVPTLGSVTHTGEQSVQSVTYRSAGVILDLLPVVRESIVDLTINQQLSSFTTTTTGVNNTPTLLKRELQTVVTVGADDVLVLGGLTERNENGSRDGFSFLPSWFSGRSTETKETEILLVLSVQRL
jgi:type II secretory pathway component GspD/PulD (secretin)